MSIEGMTNRYVVTWHVNVLKPSKYSKKLISLAVCGKTEKVCRIAVYREDRPINQEFLKIMTIQNVYANNTECEDGNYCLNTECPLNTLKMSTLKPYGIKTKLHLYNVRKLLEDIRQDFKLTTHANGQIVHYDKPLAHFKKPRSPTMPTELETVKLSIDLELLCQIWDSRKDETTDLDSQIENLLILGMKAEGKIQ